MKTTGSLAPQVSVVALLAAIITALNLKPAGANGLPSPAPNATITPVFTYYGPQHQDLVAQALASGTTQYLDPATCAVRIHMVLTSDSIPGPMEWRNTKYEMVSAHITGLT